MRFGFYIVKDK